IDNREELLPQSIFNSLKKLTDDHLAFLEESHAAEKDKWEGKLAELNQDERYQLESRLQELESQLNKLKSSIHEADIELTGKIDEILKNAYLMPFQTRELAESYLESCQPSFKIGLF